MKTICIIAVLSLFTSLTSSHATDNQSLNKEVPILWTAEQAVAFALSGNPDNTIARKRIEEAQATATMAKSAEYPLINVSAEYGQTNNPMYSFGNILNQGAFNDTIDFNDPGRTDNLQLLAQIEYRMYNGGRDHATMEGAEANINVTQSELAGVHQQLGFEVVKTFQAIIQAEKMTMVRAEALDAITAAFEVGTARHEAGDLLKQDLLNLELQQSLARENLILSKHTLELTKRSFLNLLGLRDGEVTINPDSGSQLELP
jgi:outer membrane protein